MTRTPDPWLAWEVRDIFPVVTVQGPTETDTPSSPLPDGTPVTDRRTGFLGVGVLREGTGVGCVCPGVVEEVRAVGVVSLGALPLGQTRPGRTPPGP